MPRGTSKNTAIIQRLLEERRQYEAWIARLNDSADATPGQVRARVRSDYEARLAAVTEELKAHADSARQAIEEKRHLRGELQKKETTAAEKLTEAELRHAVGEYDEGQWGQVHKDILAEVVSVREDLQAVEADLRKLQELDALVHSKPTSRASRRQPRPLRPPSARTPDPTRSRTRTNWRFSSRSPRITHRHRSARAVPSSNPWFPPTCRAPRLRARRASGSGTDPARVERRRG